MMEKEFIPYEQALALRELGFDEPCLLHIQYSSGTDVFTGRKFKNSIWLGNGYDAEIGDKKIKYKFPKHSEQSYGTLGIATFSQAFRWFREKYGYFQLFDYQHGDSKINRGFFFNIVNIDNEDFFFPEDFENQIYKTYEEAELECLKKLIEIVKKQK